MEGLVVTVRQVSNGFVVDVDHPVDGQSEHVFPKYFQLMRFLKEQMKEEK